MKYCVIGKSLPHTLSPVIHSLLGRADYGVRELADEDALKDFVQSRECEGYNVTIPYKRAIIPMLDEIRAEAAEIGAVNTVVTENGKLVGYNTDADGMIYALRRAGISLTDKNVLILGSGGTCQTAKYVCRICGARSVNVVSRTGGINYENCYDLKDVQIIINTTPVGMMPHADAQPVELVKFERLEGVFDCIYNPLETKLISGARALRLKAANGLAMLVEQARAAHNLYQEAQGQSTVGEELTEAICNDLGVRLTNIVLIGMAGSGKSAIGKAVANILNRPFIDTDKEIESVEGRDIPQIFKESGEEYFRRVESEVIERVCGGQGLVIATGGGAVLNARNVFFMKSNGLCYLIERDVNKLATKGRPLSCDLKSAARLYEVRKPAYFAAADAVINNDLDVACAVNRIAEDFEKRRKL